MTKIYPKRNAQMKMNLKFLMLLGIGSLTFALQAQNRCKKCNIGFDGELVTDTMVNGTGLGIGVGTDDWFNGVATGPGNFPIDTTGAFAIRNAYSGGGRFTFKREGRYAPYYKNSGKTWIWAAYLRDNVAGTGFSDSSSFSTANKNGEDPILDWVGGIGSVNAKSDIIDAGILVARDGLNSNDSLYLMGFVTTRGTTGNRFFDFELYKSEGSYNPATGRFSNTGPDQGHTSWKFQDTGAFSAVREYGDVIVAVTKGSTGVELLDLRIWMRRSTFDSMRLGTMSVPKLFTFNFSTFDGPSGTSQFGYASITYSGTGYICGEENDIAGMYSPVPPWGSINSGGTFTTANYSQSQLIEFSLNLTRLGIDPYSFATITNDDWCNAGFGSVMVKTRQSGSSFTSNMDDFVGPASFVLPELTLTAEANNINCVNTTASLNVTNNTGDNLYAYYEWVNTSTPSSVLSNAVSYNPPGAGTYKVYASRGAGCLRTDSVTLNVALDNRQPVARVTISDTLIVNFVPIVTIYGGSQYLTDSVMAIDSALFGPSQGLTYQWFNDYGFSSALQNPQTDDSGIYTLVITEPRNGCKDTAQGLLVTLNAEILYFNCSNTNTGVALNWAATSEMDLAEYRIYRAINGTNFTQIASVPVSISGEAVNTYSFTDNTALDANRIYKLMAVNKNGMGEAVNYCSKSQNNQSFDVSTLEISPNPASAILNLDIRMIEAATVFGFITDVNGKMIQTFSIEATEGKNAAQLDVNTLAPGMYILHINAPGLDANKRFIKE